MALSLAQFVQQILSFRGPIANAKGEMTPEFKQMLYGVNKESEATVAVAQEAAETAQTAADNADAAAATAQSSATAASVAAANASLSSAFLEFPNGKNITWYDPGTGFPAGDPNSDFTITARDNAGTQVATMVVRGTLTTATGLIALSVQSESASTGYAIDEVFLGSGSVSATATITVTLPDSSKKVAVLSWRSSDISIGGEFVGY